MEAKDKIMAQIKRNMYKKEGDEQVVEPGVSDKDPLIAQEKLETTKKGVAGHTGYAFAGEEGHVP